VLTGGSRTALPRHQTLRALIDWSHDLLTVPEQALLRRLSVFAGGWTLEAAETVCSGIQGDPLPVPEHPKAQTPEHPAIEPAEVIDLLASLVEKSLVVYEEQKGEGRYGLLETVRQYARDRLAEAGEAMAVREWHRAFFLRLAEEAQDGARGAPRPAEHLQQIDRERDNFLAALDECIQSGAAEEGLRVAVALWRAWVRWGYQAEGCGRVAELLALPEASARTEWRVPALGLAEELNQNLALSYAAGRVYAEEMLSIAQGLGDKHLMARALSILGRNAWRQGDYKAAEPFHERSLAIWRELEERELMTAELGSLAVCARFQGDLARARTLHEQALAIHQAMGNRQGVAFQQSELGQVALQEGDCALARALCEEADAVIRELQPEMPFWSLYRLGEIALRRGDLVKARAMHEEALALYRKRGVRRIIAFSMESLGWVSLFEGDPDRAAGDFRESLNDWCRIGDRRGIAACLEGLAKVHCRQGRANRAARLFGAAGATREASGTPIWPCDRPDYERFVAETRVSLGEETFAAAWAQGRSWPLEQAIADALADG
jgi:tetratricopeptide (TPR) repeat protein